VGPFADEWTSKYETVAKEVEEVDISAGLSTAALAVKDEKELVRAYDCLLKCYSNR